MKLKTIIDNHNDYSLDQLYEARKLKAEYYEMGICVEYNKLKGKDEAAAMKAANVTAAQYDPYKERLSEVCKKVAQSLAGKMGSELVQTGGDSYKPAAAWPSKDGTPKTDIYGGPKYRISVKKKGGSQLISGKGGDAKGIFLGGKAFYEKNDGKLVMKKLDNMIENIETDFKTFNTDNSVSDIRNAAGAAFVDFRTSQINAEITSKNIKLGKSQKAEKMARAEAMSAGIIGERGNPSKWFIEGVSPIKSDEIQEWISNYVSTQQSTELKEEASDIINTAIDHKRLDGEVKAIFENEKFKKWCVFEAATGTFKFSGNTNDSKLVPIANKLLVFGAKGDVQQNRLHDLTADWAKKYTKGVATSVTFKSSKRSKVSVLRFITAGKVPHFSSSAKLLREVKSIVDEEYVDYILNTNYILNEISWDDIKAAGKKIINNIKDTVINFYQKVFKRVIDKMKEYAKKGIDAFLELLGIEIDGKSTVSVNI